MRLLLVMTLMMSFSALAQSVRENVKQQTEQTGPRSVVKDFDVQAPATAPAVKGKAKK